MINTLNRRVATSRRNTCLVTLASCVDAAFVVMRNCYDIVKACEPTPNRDNPQCALCHDSAEDYKELKAKQKQVNKEEEKY